MTYRGGRYTQPADRPGPMHAATHHRGLWSVVFGFLCMESSYGLLFSTSPSTMCRLRVSVSRNASTFSFNELMFCAIAGCDMLRMNQHSNDQCFCMDCAFTGTDAMWSTYDHSRWVCAYVCAHHFDTYMRFKTLHAPPRASNTAPSQSLTRLFHVQPHAATDSRVRACLGGSASRTHTACAPVREDCSLTCVCACPT